MVQTKLRRVLLAGAAKIFSLFIIPLNGRFFKPFFLEPRFFSQGFRQLALAFFPGP